MAGCFPERPRCYLSESVKRFEWSWGLDTALYKNLLPFLYQTSLLAMTFRLTSCNIFSHWWHTVVICDRRTPMSSCCCFNIHSRSRMWVSTTVSADISWRFNISLNSAKYCVTRTRTFSAVPWTCTFNAALIWSSPFSEHLKWLKI